MHNFGSRRDVNVRERILFIIFDLLQHLDKTDDRRQDFVRSGNWRTELQGGGQTPEGRPLHVIPAVKAKATAKAPARGLISIDDGGVATDAARLITGETLHVDGLPHRGLIALHRIASTLS